MEKHGKSQGRSSYSKVTFIPKVGKKDLRCFRPICFTSFLLKTMKVMDNYIMTEYLEETPHHNYQHTYRTGRSTMTALFQLTEVIQKTLNNKESAICSSSDISGVFGNITHVSVRGALRRRRVNETIVKLYEVLTTRIAETSMRDKFFFVKATRETPQRGVKSPLLWGLVVANGDWLRICSLC